MAIKYLNKQFIYVDSHKKLSTETHSKFTFQFNLRNTDVDTVVCKSAVIKKSFYLVPDGLNTFTEQEGVTNRTITMPVGNYGATVFANVLAAQLNASSTFGLYTVTIPNPVVAVSTARYTFGCAGGNPSFIFTGNLHEQLGFEPNSTNTFVGNVLSSVNMINMQLKDVIRIHSNMVSDSKENILQEIISMGPDFTPLKYVSQDLEADSHPFKGGGNTFQFSILDEDGTPVTLSLNVLITLMFYKQNTILERMSDATMKFIEYQYLKDSAPEPQTEPAAIAKSDDGVVLPIGKAAQREKEVKAAESVLKDLAKIETVEKPAVEK